MRHRLALLIGSGKCRDITITSLIQRKLSMATDEPLTSLRLKIDAGPEADDEELDRLTRRLRNEIEGELEVEKVELVRTDMVEKGAKSIEAVMLGALVITMLPGAINNLVDLVRDFSSRPGNRQAKIVLEGPPELLNAVLASTASIRNQSGGISMDADKIDVGGDLVAGNKQVTINVAAGATLIVDKAADAIQPAGSQTGQAPLAPAGP
jgi:hypothetical protein